MLVVEKELGRHTYTPAEWPPRLRQLEHCFNLSWSTWPTSSAEHQNGEAPGEIRRAGREGAGGGRASISR